MKNFMFNSEVEDISVGNGVYKIVCSNTGKEYIGSGNLKERFSWHLNSLRGNYNKNKNLQKDFDIYGEDAFTFIIIKETGNMDPRPLEDRLIKEKFDSGMLYNIYGSAYGATFIPEETRIKMSEAKKGKGRAESTKEKIKVGMKGKRNGAKVTIKDAIEIIEYAKENKNQHDYKSHLIKFMVTEFNLSEGTISTIINGRHSLSPQLNEMGVKF